MSEQKQETPRPLSVCCRAEIINTTICARCRTYHYRAPAHGELVAAARAMTITKDEAPEREAVYCDDCVSIKHWDAARPYVNVRLCAKHAVPATELAALQAQLDAANESIGLLKEIPAVANDAINQTLGQIQHEAIEQFRRRAVEAARAAQKHEVITWQRGIYDDVISLIKSLPAKEEGVDERVSETTDTYRR